MLLLTRPWRWLVAVLVATVAMGVAFEVGRTLGAHEYLGLPSAARLALFAGLIWVQCVFLIPSYEEMDRGEPLPPLPAGVKSYQTGSRMTGDSPVDRRESRHGSTHSQPSEINWQNAGRR